MQKDYLSKQKYEKFILLINRKLKEAGKPTLTTNDVNSLASVLPTLEPNFFTVQYNTFITKIIVKKIRDRLSLPFERHYVLNDNGVIRIKNIASTYDGTSDLIIGTTNTNSNKDSVAVQEKVLDFNKNWKVSSGIVTVWKSNTTIGGQLIDANNEIDERLDALTNELDQFIFSIIASYSWSDSEILYVGLPVDNFETARLAFFGVQAFLDKISSRNGTTAFGQLDPTATTPEAQVDFLKHSKNWNNVTIAIDTHFYSVIKSYRDVNNYRSTNSEGELDNPWGGGTKVEVYDMALLGVNLDEGAIYMFDGPAINIGLRDSSGKTIFGYNNLEIDSDHFNYDATIMEQGAKAKIIFTDPPAELLIKAKSGDKKAKSIVSIYNSVKGNNLIVPPKKEEEAKKEEAKKEEAKKEEAKKE